MVDARSCLLFCDLKGCASNNTAVCHKLVGLNVFCSFWWTLDQRYYLTHRKIRDTRSHEASRISQEECHNESAQQAIDQLKCKSILILIILKSEYESNIFGTDEDKESGVF